jgi:hypothetical protein
MPLRTGEVAKPSKIRDGAAFSELSAPLAKLGYEYGNILFNSPFDPKKDKKLGPEHFKFIKPDDLMVLTTRPPLDDRKHGDKKHLDEATRIWRNRFSQNFGNISPFVRVPMCNLRQRWEQSLKRDLIFLPAQERPAEILQAAARISQQKDPEDSEIAIGFFLRTPSIPVYGCGLLACFGMGGWETLIWNRIVRTRFPEWVSRPSFVVGQFDMKGLPEHPPTLAFADKIKVEILLEHKITG